MAYTNDTTNSKTKLWGRLLAPPSGGPTVSSVSLFRRTSSSGTWATLLNAQSLVVPTTQTGFVAYRQCPNVGLARNLVLNGATSTAHGWTLHANASVVTDATSVTGYAVRLVATATSQVSTEDVPVEVGKAYSFALQLRGDAVVTGSVIARWLDGAGNAIGADLTIMNAVTPGAWTEYALANQVAPGNARTVRWLFATAAAGVCFYTAFRTMQQTGAPAAWVAAHQQFIQRGLALYEASTNLAADGDMEAVGVASYTATTATLTKDTTNPFAGAKRLKVLNTSANGKAAQTGALAAGQAITASVRYIGADGGSGLKLVSTPGGTTIGSVLGATSDWTVARVTGTIAGGDTGWRVDLIGGTGAAVTSYFDNLAVENKDHDTMNADPSGQAFALAARTASQTTLPLPASFDQTSWAIAGIFRFDHAYNAITTIDRTLFAFAIDVNNWLQVRLDGNGNGIRVVRARATVSSSTTGTGAPVAGDTVGVVVDFVAGVGFTVTVSINGAAVTTQTITTEEAKLPLTGTAAFEVGGGTVNAAGFTNPDATCGALRFLSGSAMTAALRQSLAQQPYQDPTDSDLAVWDFDAQTYALPVYDDRLIALGTAYDYRWDTSGGSPAVTQTGVVFTTTTVAGLDSWWLRSSTDATKDLKIPVINTFKHQVPRGSALYSPVDGGKDLAVQAAAPGGYQAKLDLMFTSLADQVAAETKLKTLQAATEDLYLQTQFGDLLKVILKDAVGFDQHEVFNDVSLDVAEVA